MLEQLKKHLIAAAVQTHALNLEPIVTGGMARFRPSAVEIADKNHQIDPRDNFKNEKPAHCFLLKAPKVYSKIAVNQYLLNEKGAENGPGDDCALSEEQDR
jgi:hypothetical protein